MRGDQAAGRDENGFRLRTALLRMPTFVPCFTMPAMFRAVHSHWRRPQAQDA